MFRGGVDIDADAVDAAFDDRPEPRLELRRVDAVLVLPHADRLGVDLDQLRERVDQAASDAHGPAHRHVVVRELLARRGRRRVDRRAVLAHHEYLHAVQPQSADQLFGLAARRAVPDGECLGLVPGGQRFQRLGRFGRPALRRMGVDGRVVQQVALRVERHDLASRAESRVDGHDALLPQRRGEQQLAQVLGENPDRLVVGLLLGRRELFGLDRGAYQAFERVGHGRFHPFARRRAGPYEQPAETFDAMFGIHVDRDFQDALLLAAAHGQEAVRRDAAQGRLGVEIVGVFRPFRLFAFDEFRMDDAFAGERAAQRVAGALVFRDTFGDDVARPGEGLLRGRHFGRNEPPGLLHDVAGLLRQDDFGQRLQAPFARHGGPRAAFGFVGQVNVLQLHRIPALRDAPAEFRGQPALPLDGREHRLLAGFEFGEPVEPLLDGGDLHLVERAGRFLAVAADKGDRRPFAEQTHGPLHLVQRNLQSSGYDLFDHVRKNVLRQR